MSTKYMEDNPYWVNMHNAWDKHWLKVWIKEIENERKVIERDRMVAANRPGVPAEVGEVHNETETGQSGRKD